MLEKYTNLWKTKKALEWESNIELREEIMRYYMPKAASYERKKVSKVSWKNIADRVFSEYDRLYYADDKWYCKCVSCWAILFRQDIQCWHFEQRGENLYRFDLNNCHPQCQRCNVILNWNYKAYTLYMIDTYGRDFVDGLESNKWVCSLSMSRYQEHILERYDFIANKKQEIEMSSDNRQGLSKLSF